MKQLPRACCIGLMALSAVACQSVSNIDSRLQQLDLGSDTYIVRAGETIESIAFRYRLSPSELAALNPGVGQNVRVGSRLKIRSVEQLASRSPGNSFSTPRLSNDGRTTRTAVPRRDPTISHPVYRPQAVPSTDLAAANAGGTRNDGTLLSSGAASGDRVMRNGVLEPITYASQETVEEEYIHKRQGASVRQDLDYSGRPSGKPWTWPTQGQVARGFAPESEGRHGIDIAGVPGQPIVAVLDGTVAYSGKDPSGAGNLVIVRHPDNLLTAYSHTRDLYVAEDDTVRAGDPIATLGANRQQESVLRFEVRRDGNSLNPMEFLGAR